MIIIITLQIKIRILYAQYFDFHYILIIIYMPGKPDGLNIMLNKQKGICNFRLRPSVEENLQTCARQVVLSHISRYFETCFKNQRMLFPSDMKM
jgi:hypothetical protein